MSKKILIVGLALFALIPLVMPLNVANAAFPPNFDPYELIVDTILGGGPVTLDPANCYDTASAELLFNTYEGLIFFDGETYDRFIPQLADQVWVAPPDPAAPEYTNFTVYARIRKIWFANVTFVNKADPISTQWRRGYNCTPPTDLLEWHMVNWTDGQKPGDPGYGELSKCDKVELQCKNFTWLRNKFHVEDINQECHAGGNTYIYIRLAPLFHTWCRSDLSPVPEWTQYSLEIEDVEHSFQRWMVYDFIGGPQWMIFEPLLNCYGADPTDPTFGQKIDDSVQSNETHVWFNIANNGLTTGAATAFDPVAMFDEDPASVYFGRQKYCFWTSIANLPINYPLRVFFQVIAQSWASIMSKGWLLEYVDPLAEAAGHPVGEWPGTWANWTAYHYPELSPYPLPCVDMIPAGAANPGVTCGTGPFILQRLDYALEWSMVYFDYYWRCRPANWPHPPYPGCPPTPVIPPACIRPKGWVTRLTVRQRETSAGISEFLACQADFAAIPRARCQEVHEDSDGLPGPTPGDRWGPTKQHVRLNYPIPSLATASFHMTFNITQSGDAYGKINPTPGDITEDAIPCDFFNDVNVRKALAHLINFTMILHDQMLDEAYQACTFAPTGLPYVMCNVTKYYYDENLAKSYFTAAWGGQLLTKGFTLKIAYNSINTVRQAIAEQLAAAINKIGNEIAGGKFHASALSKLWRDIIKDMDLHKVPTFMIGWLADYADVHNFAFPYAHSSGAFAAAQLYENPTVDALINQGIYTGDGPVRSQLYNDVMIEFYNDCPTVILYIAIGRGYMKDWVQGYYYNAIYPGIYAYNKWKWPTLQPDTPRSPPNPATEGYWPGDVNFDDKVDMGDIVAIVDAFGSYSGRLGMPVIHPRWNFYCDVDDNPLYRWRDRKVDMGDIVTAVSNFGLVSISWEPPDP